MESDPNFPVGVFDSGVGGLSILRALRAELPGEDFVYFADTAHAPYGERDADHVVERSRAIALQLLQEHRVKALVVACNTATAAAIHLLRADYPLLPLVGVEPALKPAVGLSKTRRIAVLATRATLASAKFLALAQSLAGQAEFVLQPCDGLAAAIEAGDDARIACLCGRYIAQAGPFGTGTGESDTLVLGCTHYPLAVNHFANRIGPAIALVETGAPVASQTRRLLASTGRLSTRAEGRVSLLTTGSLPDLQAAAQRWLPD